VLYIKVTWNHSSPDSPILLYSELDDERWETRKVEIFRTGPPGYADRTTSTGDTGLGLEPVPPLAEIAEDPEFEPCEISASEFEGIWTKAVMGPRRSTAADIKVISGDPIAMLRRFYQPKDRTGPKLAGSLMYDLAILGAVPARVDQIAGWWLVCAARDWLRLDAGSLNLDPFRRLIPFPAAGDNCYRTEINLSAFAEAIATCGEEGITWIKGNEHSLPADVAQALSERTWKRIVAFTVA
jgi:hypothetical protein